MKADFINRMFVGRAIAVAVLARRPVVITRSSFFATVGTGVVGLFFTARLVWAVVPNP